MRWYHAAMKSVDMVFIFNIQFWLGFVCSTLIDRAMPPPDADVDADDRILLPEVLLQVVLLGYIHTLLAGGQRECPMVPGGNSPHRQSSVEPVVARVGIGTRPHVFTMGTGLCTLS